MTDSVFDIALEKRFTDSTEAVLVDITPADLMLIRNNETGAIMRVPFSVLAQAVSGALTGYMKTANNLSDVADAGTARTNLGATTLGGNLFTLPNPGAVRFPRFNADNTVSALGAASFRAAIGAGTSSTSGTVTSVGLSAPTGFTVSGSPVTGSGTLSFGFSAGYSLPSNAAQAAWDAKEPGITAGTTSQYWRGDKSWQTLNTAAVVESTNLYYTDARVRAAALTGYSVGSDAALAATDSILAAFGKVQGQLNAKQNNLNGVFTTLGGTYPNAPSGTDVELTTIPNLLTSAYLITVQLVASSAPTWSSCYILLTQLGTTRLVNLVAASGGVTLSMSGLKLMGKQLSGINYDITWSITRFQ